MRSEIGVGIIGCGSVARWKYVKNLAEMSGVSLRAFYGGRAEEFQQQYGAPGSAVCRDLAEFWPVKTLMPSVSVRRTTAMQKLPCSPARKKACAVRKPMAISAEDAVRMVETRNRWASC